MARHRRAVDGIITPQSRIIASVDRFKLPVIVSLAVMPLLLALCKPPRPAAVDHRAEREQALSPSGPGEGGGSRIRQTPRENLLFRACEANDDDR